MDVSFMQHADCKTVFLQMGKEDVNCLDNTMKALSANTVDAAVEKHVPALEYKDGKLYVQVGSVEHPMLAEHYIEWIFVQTKDGGMFKNLTPGAAPRAEFSVAQDDIIAVYEFCNIHGLWKADFNK